MNIHLGRRTKYNDRMYYMKIRSISFRLNHTIIIKIIIRIVLIAKIVCINYSDFKFVLLCCSEFGIPNSKLDSTSN